MKKSVTFTSDFGYADTYAAEVRGVIEACAPEAHVIDLTHGIARGDLVACSFALLCSYGYFEENTVHLAVVDPGVGTGRGIVAVEAGEYTFVGPDNGILYEAAKKSGIKRIVAVDEKRLKREAGRMFRSIVARRVLQHEASTTFHGRDLFAPLVAYVVSGAPLKAVGTPTETIKKLTIPVPETGRDVVVGRVIYIDHFGNLVTNIPSRLVKENDEVSVRHGKKKTPVGKPQKTYGEVGAGTCLPVTGSRGYLEIAVNGGSARDVLGIRMGDEILVMRG
ncbi:MAG: SAM-dependent chlorinase/fluorinase [Spirochaetes bacterium]|nr:SAM-dependent chlorinase/fluorinase [Spirochaetota bacterium]